MEKFNIPDVSTLRRIRSLSELSDEHLLSLANQLRIYRARKGSVVLEQGSVDDSSLYVLYGDVLLTAGDGKQKQISIHETDQLTPVAQLRPSIYDITAESEIEYLMIDQRQLIEFAQLSQSASGDISVHSLFSGGDEAERSIIYHIYQELMSNSIKVPQMPEIATRVCKRYFVDGGSIGDLFEVIRSDDHTARRFLEVWHRGEYEEAKAHNRLDKVLKNLGADNVVYFTLTFAASALVQRLENKLSKEFSPLWKQNLHVATLARTLAKQIGSFNYNQAMFSGLTYNLGALVVLDYLLGHSELTLDRNEVDYVIEKLSPEMTGMVFREWGFPEELIRVPEENTDWFRNPSDDIDMIDIVLTARYHVIMRNSKGKALPPISSVPAIRKFKLSPRDSIALIKSAVAEVNKIKTLLM